LLAHINDNNIGIRSFEDIFIPIVKSALCKMNNKGVKSGQSITEIKDQVDKVFALDIPISILRNLLFTISNDVQTNTENQFILHKDGAFQMNKYLFADYEEELTEKESEIDEVEKIYKSYLTSNGLDPRKEPSIFNYIDLNRTNLSRFFAYKKDQYLEIEYVHQANFINSVKPNKKIYDILRRVYLGSIIAAYLEVEIGEVKNKTELLLDTNFILGLLDLNSIEATHTCRKISEICDKLGFTKSILPFTIEEIELLIERKARQLENAFFQGYLDPESIYNAAKRRNLSKTQLQQIAKRLTATLSKEYKINLVGNDTKFRNLAKYQYANIFEFYKGLRGAHGFSALHDTTAIVYVKEKRGKPIKGDLMKANCWFVTNTPFKLALPENTEYLPEIIRAEEIINFLWLSNPSVTTFINSSDLSSLGLTRLVSTTISYSLPSPKVLRDLDDNFNAYGGTAITADDTIMVASMIAKKRIDRPEELNKIALQNPDNFISKVKDFADQGRREEKEMQEKLQKILERLDIRLQRYQEKRKQLSNEVSIRSTVTEQPKLDTEKQKLQISNQRLRTGLIAAALIIVSMIWWAFDHLFPVPHLLQQPNYFLLKVVGQLLLITLTAALFFRTYRASWITTTVALTICFIMLFKRETKQVNQDPPNQEISQPITYNL
jgi:cytidylate kinase